MKARLPLLLLAGSLFFACGWGSAVKRGVCIDGIDVGGMPFDLAEERIRAHIREELPLFTVHTPRGDRVFSLDFSDDLSELLRRAKRGEALSARATPVWVDAEEELLALCGEFAAEPEDARLTFSTQGFSYRKETCGTACDYEGLCREVFSALAAGKFEATLHTFPYAPAVTESTLRARTRPLAAYTTYFDASNAPRAHNIALAAERLSGSVIEPGGELSFNAVVGKRTEENGFEKAAVIQKGEYVQGVGGGVCQASTTLMNAALRSGLVVKESRPHSLAVGYVAPSLDAMVSETSDLKLVNPYPVPVYLLGRAREGSVRFCFYGLPDGKRYVPESKVLLRVEPPPEKVIAGEEERIVRAPKTGIASECWLNVYEGDKLVERRRLRKDVYAAVQGIREVRGETAPEDGELPQQQEQLWEEEKTFSANRGKNGCLFGENRI